MFGPIKEIPTRVASDQLQIYEIAPVLKCLPPVNIITASGTAIQCD